MPFDGSGNYSRVHNWQADRDADIKILASRMDAECDDYAAAFNLLFFRNGLVPMSGNLNMGQNYINNLGAGSVAALPFKFADDANTGLYLDGYGKLGLVSVGTKRLEVNTGGIAVTGTLSSSGAFTSTGAFVASSTAAISGNTTIGGTLGVTGASTLTGNATIGGTLGVTGVVTFSSAASIAGEATMLRARITATNDVNEASTLHGFQIGSSAGENVRIDTNEIMWVDNGVLSSAYLSASAMSLQAPVTMDNTVNIYKDVNVGTSDLGGTTDTRLVTIASNGFAVIKINGDYSNTVGEPGGAALALAVDGTGINGVVSFVNSDGIRGDSTTVYTDTLQNSMLVGATGSQNLQFGAGNAVRATILGSNGRVGIGTTSPSSTVDIRATGDAVLQVKSAASGSGTDDDAVLVLDCAETGEALVELRKGGSAVGRLEYFSGNTYLRAEDGASSVVWLGGNNTNAVKVDDTTVYVAAGTLEVGYRNIPQVAKTTTFTLADNERGKHVYYTGSGHTGTIPPNSSVAYPLGATIVLVNDGSGDLTIGRGAGVALIWNGTDANRTLAVGGMATIVKVGTNRWFISGTNLS